MNRSLARQLGATLRLPRTSFPLRHQVDSDVGLADAVGGQLYQQQERDRKDATVFEMLDGPPFANGNLHVGHALNKILKDIAVRHALMEGQRVKMIPGWDCHGLPIEMKAMQGNVTDPLAIRRQCRAFAEEAIRMQRQQMQSWGLLMDPEARFETKSSEYQARELLLLASLARQGLVFQANRPVYWSPSSRTALAEAELEYRDDHETMQAYVKMQVLSHDPSALIWTTTPWTLPANQAIGYNPSMSYSIFVTEAGEKLILADELAYKLPFALTRVAGFDLKGAQYVHPLTGQLCPFLAADWVTAEQGTGLVHLAPAHGMDDYATCIQNGIQPACHVDEQGLYTPAFMLADLRGKPVLESNSAVLRHLGEQVMLSSPLKHRYPIDWRTKQPLIQRATPQWFLDIEKIKDRLPMALEQVNFIPESGKKRLLNACLSRSTWCISRQRVWGTPLPSLIEEVTGKTVLIPEFIEELSQKVKSEGPDAWWTMEAPKGYRKGGDTLDVWFDSGCAWWSTNTSSHLIIEGSDQHRGWFQSLLLTALLSDHPPPYRQLCTHGFIMDGEGRKMSKSLGNVVEPAQIVQQGGVDLLRWWVASGDWQSDISIGKEILQTCTEQRQKIRNTIRFMLGVREANGISSNSPLDMAGLNLAMAMQEKCRQHLQTLDTKRACQVIHGFVDELSAIYLDAIKDRLYADDPDSLKVKQCRGTVAQILQILLETLQPLLPFLVHEAHRHAQTSPSYRYSEGHPDTALLAEYEEIRELRSQALRLYEQQGIKDPAHFKLTITRSELAEKWLADLPDILRVSEVELGGNLEVTHISDWFKCPRCWRHWSEAENEVCSRCQPLIK